MVRVQGTEKKERDLANHGGGAVDPGGGGCDGGEVRAAVGYGRDNSVVLCSGEKEIEG